MKRISDVAKLQDFLTYKMWKHNCKVVQVPQVQNNGKVIMEFWCNGKKYAEARKLTMHMAQLSWFAYYKLDYIFVDEREFREYAHAYKWNEQSYASRESTRRFLRRMLDGDNVWTLK